MSTKANHVPLPGSHRTAVAGSSEIGPADRHQRFEVTVRLRPARQSPRP